MQEPLKPKLYSNFAHSFLVEDVSFFSIYVKELLPEAPSLSGHVLTD